MGIEYIQITVVCDECGNEETIDDGSEFVGMNDIPSLLEDYGYQADGRKILCGDCAEPEESTEGE